ncbi:SHOCT domain-containing protein [Horticoccus sp. 23ND18S-11]
MRLESLRDSGVLTEAQFEKRRAQLPPEERG